MLYKARNSREFLAFNLNDKGMEKEMTTLYAPIYTFVKKRINHVQDAEDITQDVFYKMANTTISDIQNVKSWMYTIAQNTITDYYRKKEPQFVTTEPLELPDESPYENELVQEMASCLTVFINQLPQADRKVIIESEIKGKSQKEIALMYDINYVTVRSKIQRGRQKIQKMFVQCCAVKQDRRGGIIEVTPNQSCNTSSCHQ